MAAKSKPSPISEVIHHVFEKMENTVNPFEEDIEALWKELAGNDGARHSKPIRIQKTVLNVLVDSSGWMQELSMKKRALLKGLKRRLGKDRISEIRFKIGEF